MVRFILRQSRYLTQILHFVNPQVGCRHLNCPILVYFRRNAMARAARLLCTLSALAIAAPALADDVKVGLDPFRTGLKPAMPVMLLDDKPAASPAPAPQAAPK